MIARFSALLAAAALLAPGVVRAQQPGAPVPLYPGATPHGFEQPPLPAAPATTAPASPVPAPSAALAPPLDTTAGDRVFCDQPVSVNLADRDHVAGRYRRFVGVFSDASWTPQQCAALIVENVTPDGTAKIVYAFGPMGSSERGAGGLLHGTGVIRGEELRFQNSDGSQFAFRPLYADLAGSLTTPQGQTYQAVFKRTP